MIRVAVVGATGFTGAEIARLLIKHPEVEITSLSTRPEDVQDIRKLIPELPKDSGLEIEEYNFAKVSKSCDVVFLALPHTVSLNYAEKFLKKGKIVIDLSADFRLKNVKTYETWYKKKHNKKELLKKAVYGLPELNRIMIKETDLIANPGCYPTSAVLALKPLLESNLIDPSSLIVDSKSGVSGAGRKIVPSLLFTAVNEDFKAYKLNAHQHMPEIKQVLSEIARHDVNVTFVPHLLPLERGILSTVYATKRKNIKPKQILEAFTASYKDEPFVRFLGSGVYPSLKDVQRTNFCDIGIWTEAKSDTVIVVSAIDNLLKGASGQAVQNMNIRCSFPETMGLI